MSNYDVSCPIGYGNITFVGGGQGRYCPVSGKESCIKCDARSYDINRADNRPIKIDDAKKS